MPVIVDSAKSLLSSAEIPNAAEFRESFAKAPIAPRKDSFPHSGASLLCKYHRRTKERASQPIPCRWPAEGNPPRKVCESDPQKTHARESETCGRKSIAKGSTKSGWLCEHRFGPRLSDVCVFRLTLPGASKTDENVIPTKKTRCFFGKTRCFRETPHWWFGLVWIDVWTGSH